MDIEREILEKLSAWKTASDRKPLLLMGARQTGKTWVMQAFGKSCFEHTAYFNFEKDEELHSVFEGTKDVQRILGQLIFHTRSPLKPQTTLLVFDEIQECNRALNSLATFAGKPEISLQTCQNRRSCA
jgi:predicted AAA+ superfamily ATPase